ncbi:type I methionyl aminopeptidase [Chloroflexota bacterium]
MSITVKSATEIMSMRHAGKVVALVLKTLAREIHAGMKTKELDWIAAEEVRRQGAVASFKGYRGYPAHLCVSVNDEIVHGIPGERILKEGDLVSLDMGAYINGFHADATVTLGIGEISKPARKLLEVTREALEAGIAAARSGARLGDISAAIQAHAENEGFSVVREYTGHGIGRDLHEDPQVPNFGLPGQGPLLQKGMVLALEPMINAGIWKTRLGGDGWVVHTADGSLSAHFEHTIAIGNGTAQILTID